MSTDAKIVRRRLSVLELAERLGNVSEACRRRGMTRTQFYEYKKRYDTLGLEGLTDLPPIARNHPQTTPSGTVAKICELALAHPGRGYTYLERELGLEDVRISAVTIRKILNEHELSTRLDRWLVLERQYAETGIELTKEQVDYLEKQNPAFRERHVESSKPGALVCQGIWPVGNFKGCGKVNLHAVVDTFNGYAFGVLDTASSANNAEALVRDKVLPFYAEHGLKVENVLTAVRPEFCGPWPHPYRMLLALNLIQRRLTHSTRPPSNGFMERFRRAANSEFFAVKLWASRQATVEARQADLDQWLHAYNYERPYLGYPNDGQTPYERLQRYLANFRLAIQARPTPWQAPPANAPQGPKFD